MRNKYQKIREIVEKKMQGLPPSHDFSHVMRVYNLCLTIAKHENNVDLEVLKIAALLHDIARKEEVLDSSGNTDHAVLGAEIAEKILKDLGFTEDKISKIKHCIACHRYRGTNKPETVEAKILFDADKLDSIGAIGIARSFCWQGENKARIYSDVPLKEYIKENLVGGKLNGKIKDKSKHAANLEFETKLKHIPERLYTERAKAIAKERMRFMNEFFLRLKKEINGEL